MDREITNRRKTRVRATLYRSIDWAIVHAICQNHLDDFGDFATAVVSHMERK